MCFFIILQKNQAEATVKGSNREVDSEGCFED